MKCPICNDDLKLENCVNTECGHSFCNTCFWKWTKEHNTCPLCRSSILANSEELKEQMYIRKMLEQRSELSGQIQYFEKNLIKIDITTAKATPLIPHLVPNQLMKSTITA